MTYFESIKKIWDDAKAVSYTASKHACTVTVTHMPMQGGWGFYRVEAVTSRGDVKMDKDINYGSVVKQQEAYDTMMAAFKEEAVQLAA